MKSYNRKYDALFLLILFALSLLHNYHEILFKGPWLPHMWRAADCLSITQNYFKEGLPFLTPAVHWTGPGGHGRTISEFPIIYFTVGKLWTLFGKHYFIYRIINTLFVFGGLFSLHRIAFRILNDNFWALFIPFFLFTSPALIFYTNNFLANAPAFGLALIGSYQYIRYMDSQHKCWLWLTILTFILAALLKITSLIIFIAGLTFFITQSIIHIGQKKVSLKTELMRFLPFLTVFVVIAIWYTYSRNYNNKNINIFLQSLYPIWDLNPEEISHVWNGFYERLLPSFFNKKAMAFVMFLFFFNMVFIFKKGNKYLYIVLISFIGIIMYALLWYKALGQHDYYLTNLLIIIPIIMLAFLFEIKNRFIQLFKSKLLKTTALAFLIVLVYQGASINRLKFDVNDSILKSNFLIKKEDKELYAYKQYKYQNTFEALETINPYLRSIGIQRNDLVISIPDVSINISLFLMDQKGFTDYGYSDTQGKFTKRMERFIEIGAKYLIINDLKAVQHEAYKPYLTKKMGEYKNVSIYKL